MQAKRVLVTPSMSATVNTSQRRKLRALLLLTLTVFTLLMNGLPHMVSLEMLFPTLLHATG